MKKLFASVKQRRTVQHLLILLLVPSLVSLLYGWEFCRLPYQDIPIAIVSRDDSQTARSLVQMIADNPTFHVVQYGTDEQTIQNALYKGTAAAAILIPADFSQNLLNGQETKVMLFQDGALSPLVSTVRSTITATLGTIKAGYLVKIAEGKLMLSPAAAQSAVIPMSYSVRTIGNPTGNMTFMTVEGMLLTIVQVGAVVTGAAVCEAESYRRFVRKGLAVGLVGTASGICSILLQYFAFKIPYKGSVAAGIGMLFLICVGFAYLGMFFNRFSKGDVTLAMAKCLPVNLTFLFSGYTYPIVNMPLVFQKFAWLMPNYHFILPMRDIALLGENITFEMPHIAWLAGFAALMLGLATAQFFDQRRKRFRANDAAQAAEKRGGQTA